MSPSPIRVNPKKMARELEYVKAKVNEIITNEDRPVMGKDIDLLNDNQKMLIVRTERIMWALGGILVLELLLHFFL